MELDEDHLAGGELLVVILGERSARHRGHGHGAQRRRTQPAPHVVHVQVSAASPVFIHIV